VLAAYAWFTPLAITIGFVALGTGAARYLQPWAFAPVLALLLLTGDAAPRTASSAADPPAGVGAPGPAAATVPGSTVGVHPRARLPLGIAAGAAAVGLVAGIAVAPAAARAATTEDPSLACAVHWVDRAHRVGGGQFWSVRAVKAHAARPGDLVQVDYLLGGYAWLVNRADFAHPALSYLIVDAQSIPYRLPAADAALVPDRVSCGRFTILDYGRARLRIGVARSG